MKLGGEGIKHQFRSHHWHAFKGNVRMTYEEITPLIGPNSIDVTLGRHFLKPKEGNTLFVHLTDPKSVAWEAIEGDAILIHPGQFYLASVQERFDCSQPYYQSEDTDIPMSEAVYGGPPPNKYKIDRAHYFAPMYEGRSTLGRLGIASHITAGFGDYGFQGAFTLELYNHFPLPVRLDAGMRIGQIAFDAVLDPIAYAGAYSGDDHYFKPMPPLLGKHRV